MSVVNCGRRLKLAAMMGVKGSRGRLVAADETIAEDGGVPALVIDLAAVA